MAAVIIQGLSGHLLIPLFLPAKLSWNEGDITHVLRNKCEALSGMHGVTVKRDSGVKRRAALLIAPQKQEICLTHGRSPCEL